MLLLLPIDEETEAAVQMAVPFNQFIVHIFHRGHEFGSLRLKALIQISMQIPSSGCTTVRAGLHGAGVHALAPAVPIAWQELGASSPPSRPQSGSGSWAINV